jgi:hypothetical protein
MDRYSNSSKAVMPTEKPAEGLVRGELEILSVEIGALATVASEIHAAFEFPPQPEEVGRQTSEAYASGLASRIAELRKQIGGIRTLLHRVKDAL